MKKFKIIQTNKIIIAVLALVAVALGLAILKPKINMGVQSATTADSSKIQDSQSNPVYSANDSSLTADEKKLFYTPLPTASKAEISAHFQLALKLAQTGSQITITDCVATPDVLKVKTGDTFSVKNAGTQERVFGFDSNAMVKIPPGKTVKVTANFKNGVGLYGYGCENPAVHRSIGFVLVAPFW